MQVRYPQKGLKPQDLSLKDLGLKTKSLIEHG